MDVRETGLDFNFTYAPGITDEQILGVELAGEMWSNYLGDTHQYIDQDDVSHLEKTTINIHVEVGSDLLPDNVIGGAFPVISQEKYEDVYDAITGDITTSNDQVAVDSLFNNSSLDNKKTQILVNDKVTESEKIQLTNANLKALDLIDVTKDEYQKLDGYIVLSDLSNYSSIEWNYDYLGGAKPGTLDFLTTVTHEIGHNLGFISGTDRIALNTEVLGYYQRTTSINVIDQAMLIAHNGKYSAQLDGSDASKPVKFRAKYEKEDKNTFRQDRDKFFDAVEVLQNVDDSVDSQEIKDALQAVEKYLKYDGSWTPLLEQDKELFESIKEQLGELQLDKIGEKMTSLDLFRYSTASSDLGVNDITRGSASYFSLDGSPTDLAMSNGQDYQGSHWQNREFAQGLGVMNPTVTLNQRWNISDNDLMALDAIGWDVNYDQSMDLQALYDKASAAVANAWIGDRTEDVEKIIYSDAYDARKSRSNTFRALLSAGFSAQAGYFSTISPLNVNDSSNFNSEEVACEYSCVSCIDNWVVNTNNRQSLPSLQFDSFNSFSRVTWENDNTVDNSDNSSTLAENLSKEEDSENSNHNTIPLAENPQKEGDSDKSSTSSQEIKRELCEEKLYEENLVLA